MTASTPPGGDWSRNTAPCLVNAVRAGRAARLLHQKGLNPESASQSHRVVESVMEAGIAARKFPIPEVGIAAGTHGRAHSVGSHQLKREAFHRAWLSPGRRDFTAAELSGIASVLAQIALEDRNGLLYVNYSTARPPTLSANGSASQLAAAKLFYRTVAKKLRRAAGHRRAPGRPAIPPAPAP